MHYQCLKRKEFLGLLRMNLAHRDNNNNNKPNESAHPFGGRKMDIVQEAANNSNSYVKKVAASPIRGWTSVSSPPVSSTGRRRLLCELSSIKTAIKGMRMAFAGGAHAFGQQTRDFTTTSTFSRTLEANRFAFEGHNNSSLAKCELFVWLFA